VPQNCVLSHSLQRVLSEGAKWGCYVLVSVSVLEILSGGAEYPLGPTPRLAPALPRTT